jgi:hypothetical protein
MSKIPYLSEQEWNEYEAWRKQEEEKRKRENEAYERRMLEIGIATNLPMGEREGMPI